MTVNLEKGGNVNLSKEVGDGLATVMAGLGWDARSTDGEEFDLDASAFVVGANGLVLDEKQFVFYGNDKNPEGTVVYGGDNRTGEGEGDDETIKIDLAKLPPEAEKVVLAVTIYKATERKQSFGQVQNAFIRIVNDANEEELTKYDLGEDYALETAVIFGELYRNGSDWKFKAIGQGYNNGLEGLCKDHGVNV